MRVYLAGPPFADEYRRRAEALVRAVGWESVDPMRRDFRGHTEGKERSDAMLAAFTAADEGTAMETWYAHRAGKRVVVYTGGTPAHPWAVYVADAVCPSLEEAVAALATVQR